jgi:hypothetical protein
MNIVAATAIAAAHSIASKYRFMGVPGLQYSARIPFEFRAAGDLPIYSYQAGIGMRDRLKFVAVLVLTSIPIQHAVTFQRDPSALWKSVKKTLLGPHGNEYFENRMKDAQEQARQKNFPPTTI